MFSLSSNTTRFWLRPASKSRSTLSPNVVTHSDVAQRCRTCCKSPDRSRASMAIPSGPAPLGGAYSIATNCTTKGREAQASLDSRRYGFQSSSRFSGASVPRNAPAPMKASRVGVSQIAARRRPSRVRASLTAALKASAAACTVSLALASASSRGDVVGRQVFTQVCSARAAASRGAGAAVPSVSSTKRRWRSHTPSTICCRARKSSRSGTSASIWIRSKTPTRSVSACGPRTSFWRSYPAAGFGPSP